MNNKGKKMKLIPPLTEHNHSSHTFGSSFSRHLSIGLC